MPAQTYYFNGEGTGNGVQEMMISQVLDEFGNRINITPDFLNVRSIVLASATEIDNGGSGLSTAPPFQGTASIQVLNCVPALTNTPQTAIYIRVNIEWSSPIAYRVNGILINPPAQV